MFYDRASQGNGRLKKQVDFIMCLGLAHTYSQLLN